MRNRKKVLIAALAFGLMMTATVHAATGESIGASITNEKYKLSSKAPIEPIYSNAKVSTSCGNYSSADKVESVIWYNKTVDVTLGTCTSKFVIHQASKGRTVSKTVTLPATVRHFSIGIYAGKCNGMRSATEKVVLEVLLQQIKIKSYI